MKFLKTSLIVLLTISMVLPTLLLIPFASPEAKNGAGEIEYDAEIMKVKGGAKAIATMTFDDGVHATNTALLPLLEKYDLDKFNVDFEELVKCMLVILADASVGAVNEESKSKLFQMCQLLRKKDVPYMQRRLKI